MIIANWPPVLAAATMLVLSSQPGLAQKPEGGRQLSQNETVAELPYARGHSFANLDEYLTYLEKYNGPIDLPWWREVKPGLYELVAHIPGRAGPAERATRAELVKRFGFERSAG